MANAAVDFIGPESALDKALIAAFDIITFLDPRWGSHGMPIVDNVMVWIITKAAPATRALLKNKSSLEAFKRDLRHLAILRRSATEKTLDEFFADALSSTKHYFPAPPTLLQLRIALRQSEWKITDPEMHVRLRRMLVRADRQGLSERRVDSEPGHALNEISERFNAAHRLHWMSKIDSPEYEERIAEHRHQGPLVDTCIRLAISTLYSGARAFRRPLAGVLELIVSARLESDFPHLVHALVESDEVGKFYEQLSEEIHFLRHIETYNTTLGQDLLQFILIHSQSIAEATTLIDELVREVEKSRDALGMTKDMTRRISSRLLQLTVLSGYRFRPSERAQHVVHKRSFPMADSLRMDDARDFACFIVLTDDLPTGLAAHVTERCCLAVYLPSAYLQIDNLTSTAGDGIVDKFYLQEGAHSVERPMLAFNGAFCCDEEALAPYLLRFGSTVPMLHIFDRSVVLVSREWHVFEGLAQMARVKPSLGEHVRVEDDVWFGDWSDRGCKMPDGTRLRPHILREVVDFTDQGRHGRLYGENLARLHTLLAQESDKKLNR